MSTLKNVPHQVLQVIEELRIRRVTTKKLEEKVESQNSEAIILNKQLENITLKLKKSESECDVLKKRFLEESKKTEKQTQSDDSSKMSFALTAAESTIKGLKETISCLYASRSSLEEEISALKLKLESKQNLSEQLYSAKVSFQQKLELTQNRFLALQDTQNLLEHNITVVNMRNDKTVSRFEHLQQTIERLKSENISLINQVASLKSRLQVDEKSSSGESSVEVTLQLEEQLVLNKLLEEEKELLENELNLVKKDLVRVTNLLNETQQLLTHKLLLSTPISSKDDHKGDLTTVESVDVKSEEVDTKYQVLMSNEQLEVFEKNS